MGRPGKRGCCRGQVDVFRKSPPPRPTNGRVRIILLFVVGISSPALLAASDDLQPCRDLFTTPTAAYQEEVRRALFPERALFSSTPVARVIVLPSFEPEWSVSVVVDPESATVELRTLVTKISIPEGDSDRELHGSRSTMRILQTNITKDLADRIGAFWRSRLLDLGPPVTRWASDGTTLHVSSWVQGHGMLCGEMASVPDEQPDTITQITELLRALVNDEAPRSGLEERLSAILDEAQADQNCNE